MAQDAVLNEMQEEHKAKLAKLLEASVSGPAFSRTSQQMLPSKDLVDTWSTHQAALHDLQSIICLCTLDNLHSKTLSLLSANFNVPIDVDGIKTLDRLALAKMDESFSLGDGTITKAWSNKECRACSKAFSPMVHPKKHLLGCFASEHVHRLSDAQLKLYNLDQACECPSWAVPFSLIVTACHKCLCAFQTSIGLTRLVESASVDSNALLLQKGNVPNHHSGHHTIEHCLACIAPRASPQLTLPPLHMVHLISLHLAQLSEVSSQ